MAPEDPLMPRCGKTPRWWSQLINPSMKPAKILLCAITLVQNWHTGYVHSLGYFGGWEDWKSETGRINWEREISYLAISGFIFSLLCNFLTTLCNPSRIHFAKRLVLIWHAIFSQITERLGTILYSAYTISYFFKLLPLVKHSPCYYRSV